MASDTGKRIGAVGRRDAWLMEPEKLYSPRSDPKHEEHANWLDRTDPSDPEMVALMSSMRENGTDEGQPIIVYTDGDRTCIAAGDRRQAACIAVNKERKAKKEPPLMLRAITTKDPVAARALENACRRDDPPMVLARRFRAAAETMGDNAAAAACGLTLLHARHLRRCLSLPPELQAKVNAREIPADVAARMADAGSEKASEAVASATVDGKVDPKRAKAAARQAVPVRAKTRRAGLLKAVEREMLATIEGAMSDERAADDSIMIREAFAQGLAYAQGKDPPEWAKDIIESAQAAARAQSAKAKKGAA